MYSVDEIDPRYKRPFKKAEKGAFSIA